MEEQKLQELCDDIEGRYNILVKFFNLVVFGNGKYPWIPFLWTIGNLVTFIGDYVTGGDFAFAGIVYVVALFLELTVNLAFGYRCCKMKQFATMAAFLHQKYELDLRSAMRYLDVCSIILFTTMLLLIALSICAYADASIDGENSVTNQLLQAISTVMLTITVYGGSLYLCMLWCLEVWMLYYCTKNYIMNLIHVDITGDVSVIATDNSFVVTTRQSEQFDIESINSATQSPMFLPLQAALKSRGSFAAPPSTTANKTVVTPAMSSDSATNRTFSTNTTSYAYDQQNLELQLFTFLHEMHTLSNEWLMNHLTRALTGLIIAGSLLFTFYSAVIGKGSIYIIITYGYIVTVYYVMIWITAVAAGIANDTFFKHILRKYSILYAKLGSPNSVVDKQLTQTMTKLLAIRGLDGMHFAGLVMSIEKALSLGSIIASIAFFSIRFFLTA